MSSGVNNGKDKLKKEKEKGIKKKGKKKKEGQNREERNIRERVRARGERENFFFFRFSLRSTEIGP